MDYITFSVFLARGIFKEFLRKRFLLRVNIKNLLDVCNLVGFCNLDNIRDGVGVDASGVMSLQLA